MSIMETMERERRPRRSFYKEFKRDAVALVRSSGKTIAEVARDLDLTSRPCVSGCGRPTWTKAAGRG